MDWKLLIADLKARNFRQEDIASFCKCAQSSISDLATGKTKEPHFTLATSLITLHKNSRRRKAVAA